MSAQIKALCFAVSLLALVTVVITGVLGRFDIVNAVGLAAAVSTGTGAFPPRPGPS